MFIEMTGRVLRDMLTDDELGAGNLADVGVDDDTVIRVNKQGDIEIRRAQGWDIVGGLLGEFESRVKKATGLDWA